MDANEPTIRGPHSGSVPQRARPGTTFSVKEVATAILLLLLVALGADATHWQNVATGSGVSQQEASRREKDNQRPPNTEKNEQTTDPYDVPLRFLAVIFGGLTVGVIVFQSVVFRQQLILMRRQTHVSIRQAATYARQAAIMTDQIKLGREEFNASHRPNIEVHSVRLLPEESSPPTLQAPPVAEFAIVNAGTSGCTITGSAVDLGYYRPLYKPHLPALPRNDIIRPQPFGIGATDNSITVQSDRVSADHHGQAIFREAFPSDPPYSHTLYLSGWITYAEAGENVRTTYFRRRYNHQAERFVLTGDPDDEKTY